MFSPIVAVRMYSEILGWYRHRVVIPASLMIAAIGIYWTITRLL